MSGTLFIVMGSQDTSDMESSSNDYTVCHYGTHKQAERHANRAKELAFDIHHSDQYRLNKDEVKALRVSSGMVHLDPYWMPGNTRPTHYYVQPCGPGVRDMVTVPKDRQFK